MAAQRLSECFGSQVWDEVFLEEIMGMSTGWRRWWRVMRSHKSFVLLWPFLSVFCFFCVCCLIGFASQYPSFSNIKLGFLKINIFPEVILDKWCWHSQGEHKFYLCFIYMCIYTILKLPLNIHLCRRQSSPTAAVLFYFICAAHYFSHSSFLKEMV